MAWQAVVLFAVGALTASPARVPQRGATIQNAAGDAEVAGAVAGHFVDTLRQRQYPFLDEAVLRPLHAEIEEFVARFHPARMSPAQQRSLMSAIDRYVPELFLHRRRDPEGDYWARCDAEGAYRKFRDLVNTFKWQLWRALTRDRLTAEQSTRLRSQHGWLRRFVAGVQARPGDGLPPAVTPEDVHAWASERLERMLTDPLGLLCDPMTDPQFEVFKQLMHRSAGNGLITVVADVPVRALGARAHISTNVEGAYAYPFDITLPFDDEVTSIHGGGEGGGPHLVFASNARFRGPKVYLDSRNRPIFDMKDGVCGVPEGRSPSSKGFLARWQKEQKVGDLAYDDSAGTIVAIRGARMAVLSVKNWFEADRVTDAELRRLVFSRGVTSISVEKLPPVNGTRRVGQSDPRFFVVLQTGDNHLAVLDLRSREFGLCFVSRLR
jgi:hypothetical protein